MSGKQSSRVPTPAFPDPTAELTPEADADQEQLGNAAVQERQRADALSAPTPWDVLQGNALVADRPDPSVLDALTYGAVVAGARSDALNGLELGGGALSTGASVLSGVVTAATHDPVLQDGADGVVERGVTGGADMLWGLAGGPLAAMDALDGGGLGEGFRTATQGTFALAAGAAQGEGWSTLYRLGDQMEDQRFGLLEYTTPLLIMRLEAALLDRMQDAQLDAREDDAVRDTVEHSDALHRYADSDRAQMIDALLDGPTGDQDEAAIVALARASVTAGDLPAVIERVGFATLIHAVNGAEYRDLEQALRDGYYPHADVNDLVDHLLDAVDGHTAAWEERMVLDILLARRDRDGDVLIAALGAGDWNAGVARVRDELDDDARAAFDRAYDTAAPFTLDEVLGRAQRVADAEDADAQRWTERLRGW